MKKISISSFALFFTAMIALTLSCKQEVTTDFTLKTGAKDGTRIWLLNGLNAGPLAVISGSGASNNVDLIEEYKKLKIEYVRTQDFYGPFDMPVMYPDFTKNPFDRASFDLAESDRYFQGILDAGCETYFRLGDSWDNVHPPEPSEQNNWVQAAISILAHYREGQWSGFNSKFTYVEIGNEPDNDKFWPKERSILEFFALFDTAAKNIKEQFPDMEVGGPGFTQNIFMRDTTKQTFEDFLDYLKQNNTPFDFLSFHQYSNDPTELRDGIAEIKAVLQEKGFENVALHFSEWNTDIEMGKTPEEQAELRLLSRGAAINTAKWIELQNAGVEVSTYFRGNDTSTDLTTFYGLYTADGKPKKMAYAFEFWRDFAQYTDRITLESNNNDLQLWSIASQKADGNKAVLIANPSSQQYTYMIDDTGTIASVYEISDAHDGIYEHSSIDKAIVLPAESIQLILIQ